MPEGSQTGPESADHFDLHLAEFLEFPSLGQRGHRYFPLSSGGRFQSPIDFVLLLGGGAASIVRPMVTGGASPRTGRLQRGLSQVLEHHAGHR